MAFELVCLSKARGLVVGGICTFGFILLLYVNLDEERISVESFASHMRGFTDAAVTQTSTSPTNVSSAILARNLSFSAKNASFLANKIEDVCSAWSKEKLQPRKVIRPLIYLDPDRFLYPGLLYGPNNQMHGFWQSVYLAIRLNRTLVLPRFASHISNGQTWVPPYQRIDVQTLRQFISTITVDKFRRICNGTFDVAFQAMKVALDQLGVIEASAGMKLRRIPKHKGRGLASIRLSWGAPPYLAPSIPTYPLAEFAFGWLPWVEADQESLRGVYNSTKKCAVFVSPYRNIKLPRAEHLPPPPTDFSFDNSTDLELYTTAVKNIRAPKCVREAATDFVANILDGDDFLAIHWRFNKADWGGRCLGKITSRYIRDICAHIDNVIALDVAKGVAEELTRNNITDWSRAYIAVPPDLNQFKARIYKAFSLVNPRFKAPRQEIEDFLSSRYRKCWMQHGWNRGDVTSMVEQEIVIRSAWFFYSKVSTWSANIQPARLRQSPRGKTTRKFEASAFDVTKIAMLRRLAKAGKKIVA